jgi:hypothetical protein
MVLATVLLLFPFPQSADAVQAVAERPAGISIDATKDSSSPKALPSRPEPKIKGDAEIAGGSNAGSVAPAPSAEPVAPGNAPLSVRPGKPAFTRDYGTEKQKKVWYALTIVSSGAAAFDAWSTRRAISAGAGTESNPMLAPFAHSGALYAATQVSPLVMDLIGRKMMTSENRMVRRMWWLPQSLGMGMSFSAGVHNVRLVPSH